VQFGNLFCISLKKYFLQTHTISYNINFTCCCCCWALHTHKHTHTLAPVSIDDDDADDGSDGIVKVFPRKKEKINEKKLINDFN
jgi:hypothetical protein